MINKNLVYNLGMIMVPPQNISKQLLEHPKSNCNVVNGDDSYKGINGVSTTLPSSWYVDDRNGTGGGGGGEGIGSDHLGMVDDHGQPMAAEEDGSRTSSLNESGSASSSKGNTTTTTTIPRDDDTSRWLQLGLGASHELNYKLDDRLIEPTTTTRIRNDLVELNLFSGDNNNNTQHVIKQPMITKPPNTSNMGSIITPSLFLSQPRSNFGNFLHQQEVVSWGYRPNPWNPIASNSTSPSSSNSLLPMASPMSPGYQQQQQRFHHHNTVLDMLNPNSDLKVVNPPRRPHSGVWVILQASQAQEIEPSLPQIPKNYLRIKDGKTTVRLLLKYLVNKLKLNSESEVEIRCRGQLLLQSLSVQYVRDHIWIANNNYHSRSDHHHSLHHHASSAIMTLLPHSSTTDHVMIVHYSRVLVDRGDSNDYQFGFRF